MREFTGLYNRRGWRAAAYGASLAVDGAIATFAWERGLWGLFTGAIFAAIWFAALAWWNAARVPPRPLEPDALTENDPLVMQSLLLDAAPTPLLAVEGDNARALNRAARTTFGTDDRIVPPNQALIDPKARYLRHEGRQWRIDRVTAPTGLCVAALIDVEREERAAEARASAELIEVLGHELLNGLAPLVSLAESAADAAARRPVDPALLEEITGPLARRAEGLQRFATAYRGLARLPEPTMATVSVDEFLQDCARAFDQRWPDVALTIGSANLQNWTMDLDQMHQAVWALLNNAAEAVSGMPSPQVEVSITCDAKLLTITVCDNGNGVAPESAGHIFRPFHTTKVEGSGIGLSLARQIARAHGGSLELVGANPTAFQLRVPTYTEG